MSQKSSDILKDLKEEISKLEQAADIAQHRAAVAENTASTLEERNTLAISKIDSDAAQYRDKLFSAIDKQVTDQKKAIDTSKTVLDNLLKEITAQNEKHTSLLQENEALEDKKQSLENDILVTSDELKELDKQLAEVYEKIEERRAKLEGINYAITDNEQRNGDLRVDRELLENEVEQLEMRVIELDANYKAREQYWEKQLKELQDKAKNASERLVEAQNKDKAIREDWAKRSTELDKRESVVRRMEAKVSDAEARIEELDKYANL